MSNIEYDNSSEREITYAVPSIRRQHVEGHNVQPFLACHVGMILDSCTNSTNYESVHERKLKVVAVINVQQLIVKLVAVTNRQRSNVQDSKLLQIGGRNCANFNFRSTHFFVQSDFKDNLCILSHNCRSFSVGVANSSSIFLCVGPLDFVQPMRSDREI